MAVILGTLTVFGGKVAGQDNKNWPPEVIKSSGRPWGVYMKPPRLEAIPDKGKLVAEADSEEEAKRIADALFKDPRNKFPHDLFTAFKRDGGETGDAEQPTLTLPLPGGKKLVVPLSNVDPKPIAGAKPPVVGLAGRKAEGMIGDNRVTFEFQEGNSFTITGDVKGEGQWGLAGGELTMATKNSVYLGTVQGNKLSGRRVRRDGTDLKEWHATLTPKETGQPGGGQKQFIGTWTVFREVRYGIEIVQTVQVRGNGTFKRAETQDGKLVNESEGQWKWQDGKLCGSYDSDKWFDLGGSIKGGLK